MISPTIPSGVRHNSLDATSFLVSQAGDPVVVDFEVADAEWLESPTSASMQHRRELHEHGRDDSSSETSCSHFLQCCELLDHVVVDVAKTMIPSMPGSPSDHVSLGQSLKELLHKHGENHSESIGCQA